MLRMVSYPHRLKSGHITCYLNRTYHVLTTNAINAIAVSANSGLTWAVYDDAQVFAFARDDGCACISGGNAGNSETRPRSGQTCARSEREARTRGDGFR